MCYQPFVKSLILRSAWVSRRRGSQKEKSGSYPHTDFRKSTLLLLQSARFRPHLNEERRLPPEILMMAGRRRLGTRPTLLRVRFNAWRCVSLTKSRSSSSSLLRTKQFTTSRTSKDALCKQNKRHSSPFERSHNMQFT